MTIDFSEPLVAPEIHISDGLYKIGVAIPTYKREDLLRKLLFSIPAEWNIYISDNDASMKLVSEPLAGLVSHASSLLSMFANWNRALSLVPSEVTHVLIVSDDDLFLQSSGSVVMRAIEQNPDCDMFVFGCDFCDEFNHIWKGYSPKNMQVYAKGQAFHVFEHGVSARMPGILFRKTFLEEIGAFDERFELTASDSELIQRATLLGRTVFIPETISLYRIWSGSATNRTQATDLWMSEINMWTDKIAQLLNNGHQPVGRRVNVKRYKAEIFAQNLLAGINNLRAKGELADANDFLKRHKFPAGARMKTRLRFLRSRLAIWIATR